MAKKNIFLTTAQVRQVLNYFREYAFDTFFDDHAQTAEVTELTAETEEAYRPFSAIRKTDYPGEEGYWICRYDPEYVELTPA